VYAPSSLLSGGGTSFSCNDLSSCDHGILSGLGDDDHTQYVLSDGTRPMSALVVDNALRAGSVSSLSISAVALNATDTSALNLTGTNLHVTNLGVSTLVLTALNAPTVAATTSVSSASVSAVALNATNASALNLTGTNLHVTNLTGTTITATNVNAITQVSSASLRGTNARWTNATGTNANIPTLVGGAITAATIVPGGEGLAITTTTLGAVTSLSSASVTGTNGTFTNLTGINASVSTATVENLTVIGTAPSSTIAPTQSGHLTTKTYVDAITGAPKTLLAIGSGTDNVANTEVDLKWKVPEISDSGIVISSSSTITFTTAGTYQIDVAARTTGDGRIEGQIRTYLDTDGEGWIEQTSHIATDYSSRDTDQDAGTTNLSTMFALGAGHKLKFTCKANSDDAATMVQAGTILRIVGWT